MGKRRSRELDESVAEFNETYDEEPASLGDKENRQYVTALARGLDVLRAFRPGYGQLGNQEIAEFLGVRVDPFRQSGRPSEKLTASFAR